MSEAPPTADQPPTSVHVPWSPPWPSPCPGAILSRAHADLPDPLLALIFGLAIVGAAFLLSWAAEVAQLDISAGLAIAVLAFIAVLPEYAVDLVFALNGGEAYKEFGAACQSAAEAAAGRESDCALALANMTGANRLLIGLGLDHGRLHRLAPLLKPAASGWTASSSSGPTRWSSPSCPSPPSTR